MNQRKGIDYTGSFGTEVKLVAMEVVDEVGGCG